MRALVRERWVCFPEKGTKRRRTERERERERDKQIHTSLATGTAQVAASLPPFEGQVLPRLHQRCNPWIDLAPPAPLRAEARVAGIRLRLADRLVPVICQVRHACFTFASHGEEARAMRKHGHWGALGNKPESCRCTIAQCVQHTAQASWLTQFCGMPQAQRLVHASRHASSETCLRAADIWSVRLWANAELCPPGFVPCKVQRLR